MTDKGLSYWPIFSLLKRAQIGNFLYIKWAYQIWYVSHLISKISKVVRPWIEKEINKNENVSALYYILLAIVPKFPGDNLRDNTLYCTLSPYPFMLKSVFLRMFGIFG